MNIDGKKGSKVQRNGILNYNIANIYENLLKTNFNDKNRIFNMLLFIVNKAFAQADKFYYTSYNKIDSMLTGKRVEFERGYIFNWKMPTLTVR